MLREFPTVCTRFKTFILSWEVIYAVGLGYLVGTTYWSGFRWWGISERNRMRVALRHDRVARGTLFSPWIDDRSICIDS